MRCAEHAFDFIDSNIAVLSGFPGGQGDLEVDWNFINWISYKRNCNFCAKNQRDFLEVPGKLNNYAKIRSSCPANCHLQAIRTMTPAARAAGAVK